EQTSPSGRVSGVGGCRGWLNYAASEQIVLRVHHMRCEIPHRCVRRKYRIRRHSPFRLRNCWEGRSVRASSLLRQNSSSVPLSLGRTRPCKTTASPVCWKVKDNQKPVDTKLGESQDESHTGAMVTQNKPKANSSNNKSLSDKKILPSKMGLTTSLELKKEDKFRSKKDLSIMIYYFPTFFLMLGGFAVWVWKKRKKNDKTM
ncbi:ferrichrome-binding protein, partial [Bacillus cereus W]